MKAFLIASILTLIGSCATQKYSDKIDILKNGIHIKDSTAILEFSQTITAPELKVHLEFLANKELYGRETGEAGQKQASEFLKSYYQSLNIPSPMEDSIYFQRIPKDYFPEKYNASENVLAFIKGTEKPEEVVIVSAHYDHLGLQDGKIFYGADDNSSGTSAILEIAEAFQLAKEKNQGPKRSVLFLHVTAEEIGLQGSKYYTEHPAFPLDQTIADLNIDMIGRVDPSHEDNPNYLYLIGSDRLSRELHYISEKINNSFFHFSLDYKYNDESDPNRYYYRSDHYNFAKNNIPVIFYFNGEHEDYHQPTDTPDKINYELLEKRARFIFATTWQLANMENRLLMNEDF